MYQLLQSHSIFEQKHKSAQRGPNTLETLPSSPTGKFKLVYRLVLTRVGLGYVAKMKEKSRKKAIMAALDFQSRKLIRQSRKLIK